MQLMRLGIRSVSLRTLLIAMIAFTAVPLLGFGMVILDRYSDVEYERAELMLADSARGVAQAVDARFLAVKGVATAMAASPLIQQQRYREWEERLKVVTERTAIPFQLYGANGALLVNTVTNPAIRDARIPVHLFASLTNGDSYVTNTLGKAEDGGLHARVIVAVADDDGRIEWMLHAIVLPNHFDNISHEPGVPQSWVVSVVDRNAIHIARNKNQALHAGKPLVPSLSKHVQTRQTRIISTITHEGVPAMSYAAYAPLSGWAAAVGLPTDELNAPLRQGLLFLGAVGAVLVGLAIAVAVLLARYIAQAMWNVAEMARRVGAGERVAASPTAIREVAQVGDELQYVSRELHQRAESVERLAGGLEQQVAERTIELAETNRRLVDEMARREATEGQLRQIQKMEAIGQLTGGIAHDFNNMLAVVMSSLNLIRRHLARGETDVDKLIEGGLQGAEKAADLTRRLLAYSRQQPLSPEAVDLNQMLSNMESMLRRTLPETIRTELVRSGGLWWTLVDVSALESAVINLAVNARDAMPDGGRLTIETANVSFDEAYAARHVDVNAGQYVMIAITDTGSGMAPEIAQKAFDPFFTTKGVGDGTGLGLSQVHGFVKQSGGHIMLYSEEGVGTTVKLYLPRADGAAVPSGTRREELMEPVQGNGQLVLVVEDEEEVRDLVAQMLIELDYKVLQAEDPMHALSLIDEHPEIDLLLTDIVMPVMNGRALADKALESRPDLKVLFTTGYTRNAVIHNGVLDRGVHLLVKPFTLQGLSAKLAEVLGKSGG